MLFPLLRPALFAFDAEQAHKLSVAALAGWADAGTPLGVTRHDPRLRINVAGLDFANPIGLAAGADKNGEAIDGWFGLGFGSVEIGTLTPLPQEGNSRPRLFRLYADRAVINRMGFNNSGIAEALPRAAAAKRRGILGINVGANKDSDDRIADYASGVEAASHVADYITVNISSPNTPGLRDLQRGPDLVRLLNACDDARRAPINRPRLFLKVAPDLEPTDVDSISRAAMDTGVNAIIIGNTTVSRPVLRSGNAAQAGGLSGAPLAILARRRLADFHTATGGKLPLIAAGGIDSATEAYARIRTGASLIQLYSALVYQGPGLPRRIAHGLAKLLERDGFSHVADAVGIDRTNP